MNFSSSRGLTPQVVEEMIIDVARRLRATMPIIDANEGALEAGVRCAERPWFHLALVLQLVVGLDHGHGELTIDNLPAVLVPQEPILAAGSVRSSPGAPSRGRELDCWCGLLPILGGGITPSVRSYYSDHVHSDVDLTCTCRAKNAYYVTWVSYCKYKSG